ncbi:MAG: NUDIX domain-containing protein [Treponemataceae bacterium]|nr:NUDIX domain-containing protein [Treponemataceae bacterium]
MAKHSVAGIAFKNGKVFIGKRINKGQMACRWEFPGGKAEDGEDDKISLKREFQEEFGIDIEVKDEIAHAFFKHGDEERELFGYEIDFEIPKNGYVLTEHTDTDWVPFDRIKELSFVDSDLLILDQVRKHFNA